MSVESAKNAVVLGTQFDPSNVPYPDGPAVGRLPHHDLSEFFGRRKTALRENRVSKFLALRRRFPARFSGRVHRILRLNGTDDLGDSDAQLRQLVGFYPQTHRVLARSKYLNVADARRARDRIGDIDVRVVRQKAGVVRSMRRVQGN